MKTKLFIIGAVSALMIGTLANTALAAVGFSDVGASHPNYTAIIELQSRGIIEGYADGTFKPDIAVNRVEALKIVLLGAGVDTSVANGIAEFTDTDTSAWYAEYINKAVSMEVVQGYPDGSFKPAQTINLVEALKVVQLTNNIDLSGTVVNGDPYADAYASEWYASYVQYAKDNNLIDADESNNIYPSQDMTRGKLVELIYRLILIQEGSEDPEATEEDPEDEGTIVDNIPSFAWNVKIEDNKFTQSSMTVGTGSTVRWTNYDSVLHTATSDSAVFDSGDLGNGDTFEYTFNSVGTYTYHCEHHPTMTGTIIVKPANEVPTI